jgi:glycosyltransferase involved in cell wall biosynthesis
MTDNGLISVIIPVYKTEKYLDRCVESVVNQTYKNLEIILVDDSSPDNCPQMCDGWAQRDARIKVLHIENNGVANARNKALDIAAGEYIAFADSDDYMELGMLQTLYDNLCDYDADISVCSYTRENEPDEPANTRLVSHADAMRLIALGDYKYGVLWNKLYRADAVKDFRMPQLICSEDLVFNFYAFEHSENIVECDLRLYHYMFNESSTTNQPFSAGAFDVIKAKDIILDNLKGNSLEAFAVRSLIISCFVVATGMIKSGVETDRFDYIRSRVSEHKKQIYLSNLFSAKDKLKTFLIIHNPKLFISLTRGK